MCTRTNRRDYRALLEDGRGAKLWGMRHLTVCLKIAFRLQVIVQLCQNTEEGKEKCANYVPDDKEAKFGSVRVQVQEKARRLVANPSVRKMQLIVSFGGRKIEVTHFLYDGEPFAL